MQQLCMIIKYLYIHGVGRNALVLTVLDVYSRKIWDSFVGGVSVMSK